MIFKQHLTIISMRKSLQNWDKLKILLGKKKTAEHRNFLWWIWVRITTAICNLCPLPHPPPHPTPPSAFICSINKEILWCIRSGVYSIRMGSHTLYVLKRFAWEPSNLETKLPLAKTHRIPHLRISSCKTAWPTERFRGRYIWIYTVHTYWTWSF